MFDFTTLEAAMLLSLNQKPRQSPPRGKRIQSKQNAKFILYINALFQYLEISSSPDLVREAKRVVRECTRRNRMGDPTFSPLIRAVVCKVRRCIGEAHWARANVFFRVYIMEQKLLHMHARNELFKPLHPVSKFETLSSAQWQPPLSELNGHPLGLPTLKRELQI